MAANSTAVDKGVSFLTALGIALATVISYSAHQSVGWALVHGVFNWFYVAYALWTGLATFGG
jgi:hypothetical protein